MTVDSSNCEMALDQSTCNWFVNKKGIPQQKRHNFCSQLFIINLFQWQ